jgi:hypothetical protein
MEAENLEYPALAYKADMLVKYHASAGLYSILLTDGRIIHFEPQDKGAFEGWLEKHGIKDMRASENQSSGA